MRFFKGHKNNSVTWGVMWWGYWWIAKRCGILVFWISGDMNKLSPSLSLDLIVWQRFCEPSPDLGLPTVPVIQFRYPLIQKVHALPDTADCKSVHSSYHFPTLTTGLDMILQSPNSHGPVMGLLHPTPSISMNIFCNHALSIKHISIVSSKFPRLANCTHPPIMISGIKMRISKKDWKVHGCSRM